jgi:hypothetical protein
VKAMTTNSHMMANKKMTNKIIKTWVEKTWVVMTWVEWMVTWIMGNMIKISKTQINSTNILIQTNKLTQISWEVTNHQIMDKTTQTWMMDNQLMPTVCSAEIEISTTVAKTKTREKQMNISMMPETSVIFQQIM